MKKIVYFSIFVSLLGAKVLSIDLGFGKMSLFRIMMLFIICLLAIMKRKDLIIYKKNNKYSTVFMIIWCVYAGFSFLWSVDFSAWFRNIFFIFIGMVSIIVFNNVLIRKEDVINAFRAFQWGIVIQCIIGWYEIFTKKYKFVELTSTFERIYINSSLRTPIAMTGNPNNFATLMFIGIFVSLICVYNSRISLEKRFHMIVGLSDICLLLFTTSRANILALLLSVAFLCICTKKKKSLILVIIGAATLLIVPNFYENIFSYFDFSSSAANSSNSIRLNLIKNGTCFLIDTFGVGVGAGQIESWMISKSRFYTGGITNMHNWWMEILTAYGILIFIGYLIFYIKLYKDLYMNYKYANEEKEQKISFVLCATLVGYIIASISSSSNITNESMWIFWAICIAYQSILGKEKHITHERNLNENIIYK